MAEQHDSHEFLMTLLNKTPRLRMAFSFRRMEYTKCRQTATCPPVLREGAQDLHQMLTIDRQRGANVSFASCIRRALSYPGEPAYGCQCSPVTPVPVDWRVQLEFDFFDTQALILYIPRFQRATILLDPPPKDSNEPNDVTGRIFDVDPDNIIICGHNFYVVAAVEHWGIVRPTITIITFPTRLALRPQV
jgi:hypothetical protein